MSSSVSEVPSIRLLDINIFQFTLMGFSFIKLIVHRESLKVYGHGKKENVYSDAPLKPKRL